MNSVSAIFICFALYLSLISCFSSIKPKYVPLKKLYLFRSLFPSWKFYEDIGHLPVLYYRSGDADSIQKQDWIMAIEKLDRNWKNLFLNSQGNLYHAYNSLLQQLENDKEEAGEEHKDELLNTVSYALVKNLVLSQMRASKNAHGAFYQFKLTLMMQGNPNDFEDTLISPLHALEEV